MENIVIVDCIRTGLAKAHRGTFNLTRSDDLVAHCINALLERNPAIDPGEIEDVILVAVDRLGNNRPMSLDTPSLFQSFLSLFQLLPLVAHAPPV